MKNQKKPWLPNIDLFFFLLIMVATLVGSCEGQNSPQDYLDAHNAARAQVGVGPMVWDDVVAAYARNHVVLSLLDCHLGYSRGPYGENVALGRGDNFTGRAAEEVVWHDSVRLGCARARCYDGLWFVSCNYDPRGNYFGER
ncbi:hypothetical protein C2S51_023845 [Perilla frutescens var. frutescens]|nr:hypothetical protein C2S51_023845 [Perilla frutescens var. frutescens]